MSLSLAALKAASGDGVKLVQAIHRNECSAPVNEEQGASAKLKIIYQKGHLALDGLWLWQHSGDRPALSACVMWS